MTEALGLGVAVGAMEKICVYHPIGLMFWFNWKKLVGWVSRRAKAVLLFDGNAVNGPPPAVGGAGLLNADVASGPCTKADIQSPVVAVVAGHFGPLVVVGG